MGTRLTHHTERESRGHTLPVAYRAYIRREPPRLAGHKAPPALPWPKDVLALDMETRIDPAQALMFGSWRYGHWGPSGEFICLEEGLIYADDLPATDPEGWHCLQKYVATRPADTQNRRRPTLLLLSRYEFVQKRLWRRWRQ